MRDISHLLARLQHDGGLAIFLHLDESLPAAERGLLLEAEEELVCACVF